MAVSYVKFQRGTEEAYQRLVELDRIDDNTLYFIYPKDNSSVGKLYLGSRLISGGDIVLSAATLDDLADVVVQGAGTNSFLVKNGNDWVAKSLSDVVALIAENLEIDSAPAQVFQVSLTNAADNHEAAINAEVGDKILVPGDMAIVKAPIVDGNYQHTAYVYTADAEGNGEWVAMDGNYNAENVYFDEDFIFTTTLGTVTELVNGSTTVDAAGKNVREFFAQLFAKENQPTITAPSYSLSATPILAVNAEIGNYINGYSWDGSWSAGSYQYGSKENTSTATGITATYAMSENVEDKTSTLLDGSFTLDAPIQIDAEGKKTYATVSGECTYIDSPYIPVSNIGNAATAGSLKGSTISKSAKVEVTGYRSSFYYVGTDCTTEVDSDFIRDSINKNANTKNFGTVTIPAGTKRIVFAVPGSATLNVVTDVDGMGLDVKGNFTAKTVAVEGANGFAAIDYTVFICENSNGLAATSYTVSIS